MFEEKDNKKIPILPRLKSSNLPNTTNCKSLKHGTMPQRFQELNPIVLNIQVIQFKLN